MSNKITLSLLNPRPMAEIEKELRELRNSDEYVDISKKSRAPKGGECGACENLSIKYEPRINSWTDEVTETVKYAYCEFFNLRVQEFDNGTCGGGCKKCLPCYMQTGGKVKD